MSTDKKLAVLDIDGILANFEEAFCEKFGRAHRNFYRLDDRYPEKEKAVFAFCRRESVYADLEPLPLGVYLFNALREAGMEIHLLTSRHFGLTTVTNHWLKEHNLVPDGLSFTMTLSKEPALVMMMPALVVDDSPWVVQSCLRSRIPVASFAMPWNSDIPPIVPRMTAPYEVDDLMTIIKRGELPDLNKDPHPVTLQIHDGVLGTENT